MSDERDRRDDRDDDLFERRNRGSSRDRDDDRDGPRDRRDDYDDRGSPPFPGKLRAAGRIWIAFGILILINGGINLIVSQQNEGDEKAKIAGGTCGIILVALLGGIFIHVGFQSLNGTARDTLGNAIGSMIIALLPGAAGVLALMVAAVLPVLLIAAVLNLLACAGLITAGVLALMAREDYLAWKAFNKGGRGGRFDDYAGRQRSRDRDPDDDRDDRDDRRR